MTNLILQVSNPQIHYFHFSTLQINVFFTYFLAALIY